MSGHLATFRTVAAVKRPPPPTYPLTIETKAAIKAYREAKGWGIPELARQAKVSEQVIRLIESTGQGKTRPQWATPALPAIAKALGVSLFELMVGLDDEQKDALRALEDVRFEGDETTTKAYLQQTKITARGLIGEHREDVRFHLEDPRPRPGRRG